MKKTKKRVKRRDSRQRNSSKYILAKDADLDYKNVSLIQKYINERGKIVPRRISDITAKEQRKLAEAIKRARFLALLSTGGVK